MSSKGESVPTEPIQLTEASAFDDVVADYDVVLADFYADWCGPCQMMEPTIESIAADSAAAVLKVDVDVFQNLAAQYGVQGVPTLLLFADGEPVERVVGAQTEAALVDLIEEHTA